ncbi:MAG: hypothetical protein EOP83_17720 [Verrucomicrobiaceae bacterium]|nr:MAG: hypothetical protein EOP83_17720 [Verrucomicrobiaceae bacterium]
MPPFVRFLIFVLMEIPALILWLVGMHWAFKGAWLFGEDQSAPDYLKRNWDWQFIIWAVAAMSAGYLMFEFGEVLRGKRRLGKSPLHMAKAATLHWAAQIIALLAFFGGVACYHSVKREAAGATASGLICGLALVALVLGLFFSHKWSRNPNE